MKNAVAEPLRLDKLGFIAWSRQRRAEAQVIVDACPAEEDRLTPTECFYLAKNLAGDNDLFLQFAVFELLFDRFCCNPWSRLSSDTFS